MKKRMMTALAILSPMPGLLPTAAFAACGDTGGHLAAGAVDKWSAGGILEGGGDEAGIPG